METLLRKLVGAVTGVAICIGIWTVQDRLSGGGNDSADSIPRQVWGGGAGQVTIEAEASEPAVLSASFESTVPMDENDFLETWQRIPAGKHAFTIDVPANVSGVVELRIDDPIVGARIKLLVSQDGNVRGESEKQLDKPLDPGWGFAAGVEVEDYARGKVYDEY